MTEASSDPDRRRPLAEEITVSTRSVHAKLNKLIVARLPLALPPRSPDPATYISGLLHIAPIYITFEALWRNILDALPTPDPEDDLLDGCDPAIPILDDNGLPVATDDDVDAQQSNVCARIHSILEHLHLPGLMRSDRLRADIKALSGWPDHVVEEQFRMVGQTGRLHDFLQHIKRSVNYRPHVLLAYSYILFMALFAGGRFIRACLESVGGDFWDQVPSSVQPRLRPCRRDSTRKSERASGLSQEEIPEDDFNSHASHTMPLRFFHFPTPVDGEDLKKEFKRRLADSEGLLTDAERQDIVKEAACIFDHMTLIVGQLDSVCGDPDQRESDSENAGPDLLSLLKNPLRARLQDSIAITRERKERASRFTSSSDDSESDVSEPTENLRSRISAKERRNVSGHQHLDLGDVDMGLCPGLSKSMRFQKSLPRPVRDQDAQPESGTRLYDTCRLAVKDIKGIHAMNWLMILGFGAVIIGAALSIGRGG